LRLVSQFEELKEIPPYIDHILIFEKHTFKDGKEMIADFSTKTL